MYRIDSQTSTYSAPPLIPGLAKAVTNPERVHPSHGPAGDSTKSVAMKRNGSFHSHAKLKSIGFLYSTSRCRPSVIREMPASQAEIRHPQEDPGIPSLH